MLHLGDSTYEAEHRMHEAGRVLARRQATSSGMAPRSRPLTRLREAYARQLAALGQRLCDLGCTLQAKAVEESRAPQC
jgi:hypothetical protein